MNAARALLGVYVPGDTLWHRLGVGRKYLVFLVLLLPALIVREPVVVTALVVISALPLLGLQLPLRLALGVPWPLAAMLLILGGYHALTGAPGTGVTVVGTTVLALYASRLILFTTPLPALVDAVVAAARPFARLGARPERFGLAVAILIRSIPFLAASFGDIRAAARARGLERNLATALTPVVVSAVAYARRTGDALTARGLGDD